jgi:SAM-dependent methyltransferase
MSDAKGEMRPFGFSNVDDSGREERLQEMLRQQAVLFEADRRRRFDRLEIGAGHAVLDVGCGLGEVAAMFSTLVGPSGQVVGVDLSEAMLTSARAACESLGNVELRVGNVEALDDIGAATFDVVHSERVFMHLADPDAAVRECVRVLKPGGRVMIVDPDHLIRGTDADDPEAVEIIWRNMSSTLVKNPRSGRRLRNQFLAAGLIDVAVDAVLNLGQEPMYGAERLAEHLKHGLDLALERDLLDKARGHAAIEDQLARVQAGTYFDVGAMFTVMGTKPT